jgi:uncharacterized protein (TIGR03435 family)
MTSKPGNFESLVKQSLPSASSEEMESARVRIFQNLKSDNGSAVSHPLHDFRFRPSSRWRRVAVWGAMAAALTATIWTGIAGRQTPSVYAVLKTAEGTLFRVSGRETIPVRSGERIPAQQTVQTNHENSIIELPDASTIEMRAQSELRLEGAADGVRIHLNRGSIIVNAAEQQRGHLYVQTRDVDVSVVGTVFLVHAAEEGSRVAVIQGEVDVQQGATRKTLLPGEQVTSAAAMTRIPVTEEVVWSERAHEHAELLTRLQEAAAPRPTTVVPSPPALEVAAIRPSTTGNTSSVTDNRNETVRMENVRIKDIIQYAYSVRPYQILGPEFLTKDRYTINAKAPSGTPNDLLPAMVQQLLSERFKMGLRQETREIAVYALVLGKDGPKVEASPEWAGGGFVTGNRSGDERGYVPVKWRGSTSGFAAGLSGIVGDRPVLDRTGLTGRYAAEFSYVPDAALLRGVFGPSIFEAIREFGFKLEPVRASVEFLVIEHIEKPSEN